MTSYLEIELYNSIGYVRFSVVSSGWLRSFSYNLEPGVHGSGMSLFATQAHVPEPDLQFGCADKYPDEIF